MGFIDKIYKISRTTDHISSIAKNINAGDLLSGVNLSNINFDSIDGIKNQIESTITGKVSDMTSQIQNSIDVSEIESIANGLSLSDFDIPGLEGLEGINFM